MQVLTDLIRTSYGLIRDVEIEEIEREISALEEEKGPSAYPLSLDIRSFNIRFHA